jgi:hypothetical protein
VQLFVPHDSVWQLARGLLGKYFLEVGLLIAARFDAANTIFGISL